MGVSSDHSHRKFNFRKADFGGSGASTSCFAISMNLRIGTSESGMILVLFQILKPKYSARMMAISR
jgi:hypothetical protein